MSHGHAVIHDEVSARVFVATMPGGPIAVLHGSAAVIWWEATASPADGWVARVAEAFDATEESVGDDVHAFVQSLEERGLIERSDRGRRLILSS